MSEKILNTRIRLKYDSYENWTTNNPVLLAGEVAFATIASGNTQEVNSVVAPQVLITVGDGVSHYKSLPFVSAKAADVHSWAKKSESEFITWVKTLITVDDLDLSAYALDADLTSETERAQAAEKANADAIAAIKDGTAIDSFADVETELAKKVDKVEGYSLVSDTEIARLAEVDNYDDTKVKEDIAKKADSETMTTELGKKVDKVEGYSLVADTEIARLAEVDNYDDTKVKEDIAKKVDKVEGYSLVADTEIARLADVDNYDDTALAGRVSDLETESAKHALKTDLNNYVTTESYGVDKQATEDALANRYTKEEADGKFALAADAYDDTALSNRVKAIEDDYLVEADKTELANAVAAEKERAEGVEESLQNQINTIMNNPDAEGAINSINEFTQYVANHGTIADGFRTDIDKNKEDIAANAKAIADQATSDASTYETKTDASAKLTEAKGYTDIEVAKVQKDLDDYQVANDAEVAKKANTADLATVATSGLIDDLSIGEGTTLIFDCGSSSKLV